MFDLLPEYIRLKVAEELYRGWDWETLEKLASVSPAWREIVHDFSPSTAYLSHISLQSSPCVLVQLAKTHAARIEGLGFEVSANTFDVPTHTLPHIHHHYCRSNSSADMDTSAATCVERTSGCHQQRVSANWHRRIPWITDVLKAGNSWRNVHSVRFHAANANNNGSWQWLQRQWYRGGAEYVCWESLLSLVPAYFPNVTSICVELPTIEYENIVGWVTMHCPSVTCLDLIATNGFDRPSNAPALAQSESQPGTTGAGTRSDHPVTLLPFGRFERLSASGSTVSEQWMRSVVQSQATTLRELHLSWISTRSLLPLLVIGGGGGSSSSSDGDNEKTNQPSLSTPILPHLAHLSIRRIDVSADCVEIPIDAVRFPSMQRLRIQDVTAGALRPCTDDAGAGGGEGRSPPVDAPYARVLGGVFSQPWPHLTALAIPPPSVEVARAIVSSCPKLRTLELDGYYRLGTTRFTRQCFDTIVGSLTELVRLTIPGHCDRNGRSHCDDIAVTAGRWSCVSLRHLCLRAPMTVGAIVNGLLAQLPELVSLEIRLAAEEEEEEEEEGEKASASVHSTPGVPWQHEHAQTAKPYHHQRLERLDIYGLNPVQDVSTISQLLRHLPNLKTCVLSCIVTNGSSSGMAKSGSPTIIKQLERVHRGVKFSSPREQPSTPSQSSLHIPTTTKASEHINLSTIW